MTLQPEKCNFPEEFTNWWTWWKDMEGYIGTEPDGSIAIYGINSLYNPEILKVLKLAEAAPTDQLKRAILEYEAKCLLYRKYYLRSAKLDADVRPYHFFYKNAWTCTYSRSLDYPRLSYEIYTDPQWFSLNCASKLISSQAVLRRTRIFREKNQSRLF